MKTMLLIFGLAVLAGCATNRYSIACMGERTETRSGEYSFSKPTVTMIPGKCDITMSGKSSSFFGTELVRFLESISDKSTEVVK